MCNKYKIRNNICLGFFGISANAIQYSSQNSVIIKLAQKKEQETCTPIGKSLLESRGTPFLPD